MPKSLLAALCAALLLASCATPQKKNPLSFDKAPLFGMIYDEDNQPCAGARLIIDGVEGKGETGLVTDIRGRFVLPDLPPGEHHLVARKEGYEELSAKIVFLNSTDALFLRMVSFGQLLTNAEKALEERKWEQAGDFLARAGKLDPGDSVFLCLQAVKAYRTGCYPEAVGFLNGILESGIHEPSVYLFLADIYEKKLCDQEKAIENLQLYLGKRADSDVEQRLAELKATEK
jgi:tetratricopeptide (TPR) repeat protein